MAALLDEALVIAGLVGAAVALLYATGEVLMRLLRREPVYRTLKRWALKVLNAIFSAG